MMELAIKAKEKPISSVAFVPPVIYPGSPDFAKMHKMVATKIAKSEAKDEPRARRRRRPSSRPPCRRPTRDVRLAASPASASSKKSKKKKTAALKPGQQTEDLGVGLLGELRREPVGTGRLRRVDRSAGRTPGPGVSVVMPVLNEEQHLRAAVRGVLDQDYPGRARAHHGRSVRAPTGRTRSPRSSAAADPRLTVVDNPAGRTPHALNLAIAAARHDILVRVDGHGELGDRYIERAVELLAETGAANVGGVMEARGQTPFEQAVAFVYTSRYGLGGAAFHQGDVPAGPADTVFLGVFDKADAEGASAASTRPCTGRRTGS